MRAGYWYFPYPLFTLHIAQQNAANHLLSYIETLYHLFMEEVVAQVGMSEILEPARENMSVYLQLGVDLDAK